ncbi:MAG TPA: hypothetical protein VFZ43_05225 [Anaerolineales bacterium]
MSESKKVKLSGGLDKTVTWVWLENGHLKAEYYDFSEAAQRLFGNDIAYTITVKDMKKLFSTINQDEACIISWMESYFRSYFGTKKWLEENGFDFNVEIEGWA